MYQGAAGRVRRRDHRLVGLGVVPPAADRFDVHRAQLPVLGRVADPRLEPAPLLVLADVQEVFEQEDAVVDELALDRRRQLEEVLVLLVGAEAHHALDAGAVVPGAVEQDDLARGGKAGHVALDVELALLAVRGCRQRHVLEHARAAALGDPLDHAALAGRVAALEDHDHPRPLGHRPGLQPGQLDLEPVQLRLERLARQLDVIPGGIPLVVRLVLLGLLRHTAPHCPPGIRRCSALGLALPCSELQRRPQTSRPRRSNRAG